MSIEQIPTQQKPVLPKLQLNDTLSTLFIDGIRVAGRTDGLFFIRFTTSVPEGLYEQSRLMVDSKHIRRIIDTLCQASKYYPQKPSDAQDSAKK